MKHRFTSPAPTRSPQTLAFGLGHWQFALFLLLSTLAAPAQNPAVRKYNDTAYNLTLADTATLPGTVITTGHVMALAASDSSTFFAFNAPASPTSTDTPWDGSGGGVLIRGGNMGGGNALGIQASSNSLYSAICFLSAPDALHPGVEHGAIGYGNHESSVDNQDFFSYQLDSQIYIECSDLSSTDGVPDNGFNLVQTSLRNGGNQPDTNSHLYGWASRLHVTRDLGPIDLTLYPPVASPMTTTAANGGLGYARAHFDINGLAFSAFDAGGVLLGQDTNNGIWFRSNKVNSGSLDTVFTDYDSNGHYLFMQGGNFPGQQLKMDIGPSYLLLQSDSSGVNSIKIRANPSDRTGDTNFYSVGSSSNLAGRSGHIFATNNGDAFQIANDGIKDWGKPFYLGGANLFDVGSGSVASNIVTPLLTTNNNTGLYAPSSGVLAARASLSRPLPRRTRWHKRRPHF
ncbi:MAG: hypothetical protein QM796_18810 [Chthoniobacteraceae bacterium]